MSVKVVNSVSGTIKVNAETTPAIKVESPEVGVVNVNPVYTSGQPGPTGPAGADGQGVAAGGDTGQFLVKTSDSDYATGWAFPERVLLEVRFDEAVSKGDPLYVTGYNSGQNRITVAKADASQSDKMPSFGLAYDAYSQNDNGQAISIGSLTDVDTQNAPNNFQEGDVLYVKSGGGLTNSKPTGTDLIQNVGKVGRRQQNNGEIVVMAIGRSNDIPNIPNGQVWIGNSSGVATPTDLNSLVIDSLQVKTGGQTRTVSSGDAVIDFVEGSGINVLVAGTGSEVDVTISGENASNLNKGVASFDSDDFTVTDGAVSLIDGIGTVLYDKSPQLGGNLDVNGNSIVSTSSGDITLQPDGSGNVVLGNYTLDVDQNLTASEDDYVLTYNHTNRSISLEASTGGLNNVVEDTAPQLGGDLGVNGNKIVSASNGDIVIEPNGTGNVLLGNFEFDVDQTVGAGQDNYVLTYDNTSGTISLEANAGGTVDTSGTPADDQIAIFTDSDTIEGDSSFTWSGTQLTVGGQANIDKIAVTKGTGIASAGDFGIGSRILTKFGANTTGLTAGDVYYLGASSWTQADADAASSASGMLAVAVGTTSTNGMLKEGLVKMADSADFSSGSVGDILYLSTAAGHVTVTAPSQNGDIVRVVGYVVEPTTGIIYFDPSKDWIEITA